MKSNSTIIILLLITGILSGYCGYMMTSAVAFPENPGTYAYFIKISEMPHPYHPDYNVSTEEYFKTGGDCEDRANVFKEYLKSRGETNVVICSVFHLENGTFIKSPQNDYGHGFVVWNDQVYNPSLTPSQRFYNYDFQTYIMDLKERHGYNVMYFDNGTSSYY